MRTLYVSRTPADSSVYPTISAALDAIPMDLNEPACIYLAPGIYHEKITINENRVGAESSEFSNISHGSKGVIIISQDDIFI